MRRPGRLLGAALSVLGGALAAPLILRAIWSWPYRVAVRGHSMEPTLRDGDWLLVDPDAYRLRKPRPGELIVAPDPRAPERVVVKRVAFVDADERLRVGGDHPAHASDIEAVGPLVASALIGRPWFRYWPLERLGPIS
jgi:nickel-type superoxide dismutase maturation protease